MRRHLLKRSDAYRNGWPSFVTAREDHQLRSGQGGRREALRGFAKGDGQDLCGIHEPAREGPTPADAGDDMWIYLPDTSRPVRITPLERLSAMHRTATWRAPTTRSITRPLSARTEKVSNTECFVLELTAKRKGATYQRILYWMRVEDARPVRAEFYLTSGKHIKSATFDEVCQLRVESMLLRKLTLVRRNPPQLAQRSRILGLCAARRCLTSCSIRAVLTGSNGKCRREGCFDETCTCIDGNYRHGRSGLVHPRTRRSNCRREQTRDSLRRWRNR